MINTAANGTFTASNNVFTIQLTKPAASVDYTVTPIDGDGNQIPNASVTEPQPGLPGQTVKVPDIPGYTAGTGTIPDDGGNVKVTYTPNEQTGTLNFVDTDGTNLGHTTVLGVTDGHISADQYVASEQAFINSGYTPANGLENTAANATFSATGDNVFTIELTKPATSVSYTVTPVLSDGTTPVPGSTTSTATPGLPGQTVTTFPTVPGYTVTGTTLVPKANGNVNVIYTPDEQIGYVDFVDTDGNDLGSVKVTGVTNGQIDPADYLSTEQTIINQGYTPATGLTNTAADGKFGLSNNLFTIVLTKPATSVTYTVTPVLSDGTTPVPGSTTGTTTPGLPGQKATLPTIPGYTPQKINVPTTGGNLNVIYEADSQNGKVNFVGPDGLVIDAADVKGVTDGHVDSAQYEATEQALIAEGYTPATGLTNTAANGKFSVNGNDEFTIVLKKMTMTVSYTVTPVLGNTTTPVPGSTTSTTITGIPGQSVSTPDIPGYTATATKVPTAGGNVTVSYTPDQQTGTVIFISTDNEKLGTVSVSGVTDGNVDASQYAAAEQAIISEGYTPANGLTNSAANGQFTANGNDVFTIELTKPATTVSYTVNYTTPDGQIAKTVTENGIPGQTVQLTPPDGYVWTPGANGALTISATPGETYTVAVTTPKGEDTAENPQTFEKASVPSTDVPTAERYTINYTDGAGTVVGTATIVGQPGETLTNDGTIPTGYVLAPGGTDSLTLTTTPATPLTVAVTEPKGQDTTGNPAEKTSVPTTNVPTAESYTVNYTDGAGNVIGTTTIVGDPGETISTIATTVPTGYVLTPGEPNGVTLTDNPSQPLTIAVTTPKGQDTTDDPHVFVKADVPSTDVPNATLYTVNYTDGAGNVVGTTTLVGEPGETMTRGVSANIPEGYVLTPGSTGTAELPNDPSQPIVVTVTESKGEETTTNPEEKTDVPTTDVPNAERYTVDYTDGAGDVVGTATIIGEPGEVTSSKVTVAIPTGYTLTPGETGVVTLPTDPSQPIILSVSEPKGEDTTTDPEVKTDLPDTDVPNAESYTINYTDGAGNVVGTTTIVGEPGEATTRGVSANIPTGYVLTPGNTGIADLPDDPSQPVIVAVTEPKGEETTTNPEEKTDVPTTDVPNAERYTIDYTDGAGNVVGTTTIIGEPGEITTRTMENNIPTGYVLTPGETASVQLPNEPTQPIMVAVTPAPGQETAGNPAIRTGLP
ncbi:beta strand repeat-containing protein [Secundilactobacillus paracollinoides]|uniref:beta strand repeat-containing protein n=1 Tax=Secundilactobacillus paracollinoides TaxID=240427 RepID=UPI0006EF0FFC|nr:hypothetical protein [Secundilactobacillus paracollinoides]KRL77437.1 hypothetical protein FC17_GL001262 [Secundilactobacillus paracollinoides DSM 15502 = JCM 11969]